MIYLYATFAIFLAFTAGFIASSLFRAKARDDQDAKLICASDSFKRIRVHMNACLDRPKVAVFSPICVIRWIDDTLTHLNE